MGSGKAAGSARTASAGRTAKRATTFILTDGNECVFFIKKRKVVVQYESANGVRRNVVGRGVNLFICILLIKGLVMSSLVE